MKYKIFDCSNSPEKPEHRTNSNCPFQNDVMADLKKYCPDDFEFVQSPENAEIIITNDVFPTGLINSTKLKIKRMDGIFWQEQYKERNEPLNYSAQQADLVIFISKFSEESYFELYGQTLKKHVVVLNDADETLFYKHRNTNYTDHFVISAIASNWNRPEKRFNDLMNVMRRLKNEKYLLLLIGETPFNDFKELKVIPFGYVEDKTITNAILNRSDVFVNLSYKDAAPKTVCQALRTHLPVVYANSGGVPELVGEHGVAIADNLDFKFEDKTPELDVHEIISGIKYIQGYYTRYKNKFVTQTKSYKETVINKYFNEIRKVIK